MRSNLSTATLFRVRKIATILHGAALSYLTALLLYFPLFVFNEQVCLGENSGDNSDAHVQLILFERLPMGVDAEDTEPQLRRIGWVYRLLPPNSDALDKFPHRLVIAPPTLPLLNFGNLRLPAPRETIEILKYHYKNDWWKDQKPANC